MNLLNVLKMSNVIFEYFQCYEGLFDDKNYRESICFLFGINKEFVQEEHSLS